jgi:hypothetical protein
MPEITERSLRARPVIAVDLDAAIPDLVDGTGPTTAMVIGYRGGVPVGTLDITLTDDPDAARAQLEPLVDAAVGARTEPPVPDADLPSISVVVSTVVDRHEDLGKLLDGLARLDYPDVQVVLVDNRVRLPEDDALPALLEGRDVTFVRESRPGLSAGRNAGVAAATGDVIAFTDDDVRVEPTWLRNLGSRFARDPGLDLVTGLILPAELETDAQIWFEAYYGGFSGERTFAPVTLEAAPGLPSVLRGSRIVARDADGGEIRRFAVYGIGAYGAGANMAFRRAAVERIGGFDYALGAGSPAKGGEDLAAFVDVLWTGGRMAFEPTAVVHHRHRRTLDELHRQLHGNGLGFTAMLTSLIVHDRRHLASLGYQVPLAVKSMVGQSVRRLAGRGAAHEEDVVVGAVATEPDHPRSLVVQELRGFPKGPSAYFRSRRKWKHVLVEATRSFVADADTDRPPEARR